MKYNRYKEVYRAMGYEQCDRFIDKFHFYPITEDDFASSEFIACMKEFISENCDDSDIKYGCMIFPELSEVPHPDLIPEEWGLLPTGLEILKDAYIENNENIIKNLNNELCELKSKYAEMLNKISEINEPLIEPDNEMIQVSARGYFTKTDIAIAIYRKFFIPPTPKNRYHLLTDEEKNWIFENAGLSDAQMEIFDLCCSCESLREAAEKAGVSHARIKHNSSAIIKSIKSALVQTVSNIDAEVDNG